MKEQQIIAVYMPNIEREKQRKSASMKVFKNK